MLCYDDGGDLFTHRAGYFKRTHKDIMGHKNIDQKVSAVPNNIRHTQYTVATVSNTFFIESGSVSQYSQVFLTSISASMQCHSTSLFRVARPQLIICSNGKATFCMCPNTDVSSITLVNYIPPGPSLLLLKSFTNSIIHLTFPTLYAGDHTV